MGDDPGNTAGFSRRHGDDFIPNPHTTCGNGAGKPPEIQVRTVHPLDRKTKILILFLAGHIHRFQSAEQRGAFKPI